MASVAHIAVGCAGGRALSGRPTVGSMLLMTGLSMLPDADVISFLFGIPYAHEFGHRGASHSLAFAVICGLLAAGFAQARRAPALRWGIGVTLVVASHPVLDAMTDGGLGVAMWWPVSTERLFFPIRPIPVAPIGPAFLSARGAEVAFTELVPSLPLFVYAFWPGRGGAQEPPPTG